MKEWWNCGLVNYTDGSLGKNTNDLKHSSNYC